MSIFAKIPGLGLAVRHFADQEPDRTSPAVTEPPYDPALLEISCPDPTDEDQACNLHRLKGQFLARQDRWTCLSLELRSADQNNTRTPSGMPATELLAYGARADVVLAAEHALLGGKPDRRAPLMAGIEALEEMLAGSQNDPMLAALVASTHMDFGWAWRGTAPTRKVPSRNLEAFEAHFDRAYDILSSFTAEHKNSAFFMSARCALNGAGLTQHGQISRDFEALIDLHPENPAPMRALGTYMSPRWFGSHQDLELEARRTAARTHHIWGAGGYAWVMLDVLPGDTKAMSDVDLAFFVEGLEDIVTRRRDQHTVNLIAAYCAHMGARATTGDQGADRAAAAISDCAQWVVRNHMTELHPMIWAHAAAGFANNVHVPSIRRFAAMGRRDGLRFIADLFHREIAQGHRIIFTADGPVSENN